MADKEFAGRTALVTGGSRGIGRAICARLARAGAWLAINHSASAEGAGETLELVKAEGGDGRVYQADVSSYDDTSAMYDAIETDHGRHLPLRLARQRWHARAGFWSHRLHFVDQRDRAEPYPPRPPDRLRHVEIGRDRARA